jgi:hypothetical protein
MDRHGYRSHWLRCATSRHAQLFAQRVQAVLEEPPSDGVAAPPPVSACLPMPPAEKWGLFPRAASASCVCARVRAWGPWRPVWGRSGQSRGQRRHPRKGLRNRHAERAGGRGGSGQHHHAAVRLFRVGVQAQGHLGLMERGGRGPGSCGACVGVAARSSSLSWSCSSE